MSSATITLRSLGRVSQETGIPYAVVAAIVKANRIHPAVIDNGIVKYDESGFQRIINAHAMGGKRSFRQNIVTKGST